MRAERAALGALSIVLAVGFATLGAASRRIAAEGADSRPSWPSVQDDAAVATADRLIQLFGSDASDEVAATSLREGFDAFVERMDAFDGRRSVALARGMHARAGAVWSAFCLEGALRRSAPAGATSDSEAFREAEGVLVALLASPGLSAADRVDVVQRRAILAAGFGDRRLERAALGAALALGGVDGGQISGLTALMDGRNEVAGRLFGGLLDGITDIESAPAWALRGHGLAAMAHFIGEPAPTGPPREEGR